MWDEIRIKNCNQFARRPRQTLRESTRFVTGARLPLDVVYANPTVCEFPNDSCHQFGRFIRRIVQHLDLEEIPRILECCHRADRTLRHVSLVVERQLDCDGQPPLRRTWHIALDAPFDTPVFPRQVQAVQTERRQQDRRSDMQGNEY